MKKFRAKSFKLKSYNPHIGKLNREDVILGAIVHVSQVTKDETNNVWMFPIVFVGQSIITIARKKKSEVKKLRKQLIKAKLKQDTQFLTLSINKK